MNPSPLRRLLAVTAGLVVAATGSVALAAPAGAQTPATPGCVTAEQARYEHTFDGPAGTASIKLVGGQLCEGQEQEFALVSYVAPSATFAVPQYVFDSSVKKMQGAVGDTLAVTELTFAVEVPTCFTQVDFVFGSALIDPLTDKSDRYGDRKVGSKQGVGSQSTGPQGWYNGGSGTCVAAPEAEPLPDCAGNVLLKLINRKGNAGTTFTVTGDEGFTKTVEVEARGIEELLVDAAHAKNIVVTADGKEVHKGGWVKPEDCQEPEVGEPEGTYGSTCDELVFEIVNPADGASLTSTFTPSTGAAKTVKVEPGEKTTVAFPGTEGLTVTVTGDLASDEPIAWEQPADCDEGGEAGGGSLPVTGAAAGGIAGGAAALLAVGAVLFFVARRRRVRFTA